METETLPSSLDEVEAVSPSLPQCPVIVQLLEDDGYFVQQNFAANGMSRDQSRYLLRANTLILSYSISNLEDLLIWL